jgi:hypothetical protein
VQTPVGRLSGCGLVSNDFQSEAPVLWLILLLCKMRTSLYYGLCRTDWKLSYLLVATLTHYGRATLVISPACRSLSCTSGGK